MFFHEKSSCGPCFEFEPSLFEPGVNFKIKYMGKLLGPTNEFERSLVFETGEFERPKFDCIDNFTLKIFVSLNLWVSVLSF